MENSRNSALGSSKNQSNRKWTQSFSSGNSNTNDQTNAQLMPSLPSKPGSKGRKPSATAAAGSAEQRTFSERHKHLSSFLHRLKPSKQFRRGAKHSRKAHSLRQSHSSPDFAQTWLYSHSAVVRSANSLSRLSDPRFRLRHATGSHATQHAIKRPGSGRPPSDGGDFRFPLPLPARMRQWITRGCSIDGKEIRNILVLGGSFQLMFTAYFATQNLQSSLHEEEALGASALGCMYGISIVSSLLAPTFIGLIGAKGCLVLAWFCHILYTLAQFFPGWATLVPASILLGAFLGPLWTAQGLYVSACGYSFSKRSPHSPYVILSRFNGLFFALYETTQIVGNLVSSLVLQDGVGNKSEAIVFKSCGPGDCPGTENATDIEEPDAWVMHTLLGIYMALQVLGIVLTVVMVTPLPKSSWVAKISIRHTATSWACTLVGTEMFFLVPFMIFQSLQQGVLLIEYTKAYISCPIGIHMVGFVMATYGAVTATFVLIFSRLARLTGRLPLFLLAAIINLAVLIVLFTWTPDRSMTTLIFLIPLLWGLSQAIWQTQTNAMIAVVFADRKEPAFAIYQACRAVGYTLIFSFHGHLCVSTSVSIAIGFLVVGILMYIGVELRRRFSEHIDDPTRRYTLTPEKSQRAPDRGWEGAVLDGEDNSDSTVCMRRKEALKRQTAPGVRASSAETMRLRPYEEDTGCRLTVDGVYLSIGENAQLNNDIKRFQTHAEEVSVSRYARSRSEETPNHLKRSCEVKAFQDMPRSYSLDEIDLLEETECFAEWKTEYVKNYKEQAKSGEIYVY